MASYRKTGTGRWQAQIVVSGIRKSKVFDTKREAQDWATRQEYLIKHADPPGSKETFGDVMERYGRKVSVKKRGARWEIIRIERFRLDNIAKIAMRDLEPSDFAAWRDARLLDVAPGTVRREMVLLSAIINTARKEWGLIGINPITDVRKPAAPMPRDRLVTDTELEALAISAGGDLNNATARVFHSFLFAIETGMRAGEICRLTWEHVDLESRVVHLPLTKNGTSRDVALASEAVRLIEALPRFDPVFGLTGRQMDVLWRKLRDRAGVVGLTFHDSRHTAITRLARKLDVMALARMVGHRDIRQLMTYYNESAADIAKRLG